MALRVLLADESSTIKKVMQLALQDFGVEVKAVPVGLDVLQVARGFKPDIVFTDVLLQKRNGYEVSAELKADSELRKIPIILMWSGFMELDEAKFKACRADRRLEKPFDAETLRSLVRELVPQTQQNIISQFLTFPDLPNMIETGPGGGPAAPAAPKPVAPQMPGATPQKSMEAAPEPVQEFEEPEEFQSIPLPKNKAPAATAKDVAEAWARQDLSKYKIELPKEENFDFEINDLTGSSIALSSGVDEIALEDIDKPHTALIAKASQPQHFTSKTFSRANINPSKAPPPPPPAQESEAANPYRGTNLNPVSPQTADQILREEARAVVERIAWQLLPDIVERVVREELQKLLKDAERL